MGQRLLGDDGPRFVKAYRDFYYSQPRPIVPFEGVETVLAACVRAHIPMAVVTNKISWGATEELSRAGMLHYFAAVVGADDTDRHKPDPEPVFAALERIMVDDVANVVFIGDSPADMFAARNAGALPVAATWGTLDEELLTDAAPAHIAHQPGEVLHILQTLAPGRVAPWR
jgi:pyrophosphatase PpaX